MSEETKQSGTSIAKANLKKGMSSPGAKLMLVAFFGLAVMAALVAAIFLRTPATSGVARGGDLGVQVKAPRGETSAVLADAVGEDSNNRAAAAAAAGDSYVGPFVFASANEGNKAEPPSPALLAALRRKAADYDASEELQARSNSGSSVSSSGGGGYSNSSGGSSSGSAPSGQDAQNFGLSPEAFRQVTSQLDSVGRRDFVYDSLPGGLLSRGNAAPQNTAAQAPPPPAAPAPVAPSIAARNPVEKTAARGGSICGAVLETSVNTDYNIPVFVKLLDCGDLTGTKLKGQVTKTPDDLFLFFTESFIDPAKRLKIVGGVQAVSANIDRDGTPGLDAKVNNHWPTRLASSALLALANTERQFISARGTTSTITPNGSVLTIDGLTTEQKQEARAAAVVEGAFNVITKDVGVGVNRQSTMTLPKNTLLGVQFLSDVKVVPLE